MLHFETAIVGGGIYGSALAWFLSTGKVNTVLIERNIVAAGGATAYSGGILRVYDPDPLLAELALRGVHAFRNWQQLQYPGSSPYRGTGCLYRVAKPNHADALRAVGTLSENGYRGLALEHQDLQKRFPWLRTDAGDLALWEEHSGFANPRIAATNLADGAVQQGCTRLENCEVSGIDQRSGVWHLRLPFGYITCNMLLLATGAFAPQLLPGVPVYTRSITLCHVAAAAGMQFINHPVIDEVHQTYFRPAGQYAYSCGTQVYQDVSLPHQLTSVIRPETVDALARMRQLLKRAYLGSAMYCSKGFDAYTENKRPCIGQVGEGGNAWVLTGFSGRGFKYALPVAKSMAALVARRLGKQGGEIEDHCFALLQPLLNEYSF